MCAHLWSHTDEVRGDPGAGMAWLLCDLPSSPKRRLGASLFIGRLYQG